MRRALFIMAILFADKPLLWPAEVAAEFGYEGEVGVRQWMERFLPLRAIEPFCPTPDGAYRRLQTAHYWKGAAGPAKPPYPELPPPTLGRLIWPTGANRWAYFLALADSQIVKDLASIGNSGATLSINGVIEPTMYPLTPRRITCVEGRNKLWLLPLVDQRYFWQSAHMGEVSLVPDDDFETWTDLFSWIGNRLGLTVTLRPGTVHAQYHKPDFENFARQFERVPALFDAAAMSILRRVVVDFDGSVSVIAPDEAAAQLADNLYYDPAILAGGDMSDDWYGMVAPELGQKAPPESLLFVFPKWRECRVYRDTEAVAKAVTATDAGSPWAGKGDAELAIATTLFADFTGGSGSADNDSDLQAFADHAGEDWYSWLDVRFDYTIQGAFAWGLTGGENYIDAGCDTTIVAGLPWDFSPSVMLCRFDEMPLLPERIRVEFTQSMSMGGQATCNVVTWDGAALTANTTDFPTIEVHDGLGMFEATAYQRGLAEWWDDARRWELYQKECNPA